MAQYTITFNANGGSGAPSAQTTDANGKLAIPITAPTKPGSTFISWNENSDGSGYEYIPGNIYTFSGNKTLYAIFANNVCNLTYRGNGGVNVPQFRYLNYGDVTRITKKEPTRSGYRFIGWAESQEDADAGIVMYKPNDVYLADISRQIYAVWVPEEWKPTTAFKHV